MMPWVGCLALIRSVLAAIPLYQLIVLSANKKALKQVNKILPRFLWVGRPDANGDLSTSPRFVTHFGLEAWGS
jgi:hypothetical protein